MTEYRQMTDADIVAGLRLCRATGWNQLAIDWQAFLQLRPGGSCVATQQGKVVGTVTTISYSDMVGWIGMVLVDTDCQRKGIGKQLLEKALQLLKGVDTVKLDATPAGRAVYLKLGFEDEFGLSRMISPGLEELAVPVSVAALQQLDLQLVSDFDAGIFGVNRENLLQRLYEGLPKAACVVKTGEDIQGYCLGRRGYNFFHIGPVVALDMATAKSLVAGISRQSEGKPLVLDVPLCHPDFINWLMEKGFAEQRQFVRMFRGSNKFPGDVGKQFAIVGPEFG
jgi:GNAT superfamily N-acetyltransferase